MQERQTYCILLGWSLSLNAVSSTAVSLSYRCPCSQHGSDPGDRSSVSGVTLALKGCAIYDNNARWELGAGIVCDVAKLQNFFLECRPFLGASVDAWTTCPPSSRRPKRQASVKNGAFLGGTTERSSIKVH